MAEARGAEYFAFESLDSARQHPDSAVILEGDDGGTIYLTIPARLTTCSEVALRQLLVDIDAMCWADASAARVLYELFPVGSAVAGGMGGGLVSDGLWLHREVETLGVRREIEEVLAGRQERISIAGRRWK